MGLGLGLGVGLRMGLRLGLGLKLKLGLKLRLSCARNMKEMNVARFLPNACRDSARIDAPRPSPLAAPAVTVGADG